MSKIIDLADLEQVITFYFNFLKFYAFNFKGRIVCLLCKVCG